MLGVLSVLCFAQPAFAFRILFIGNSFTGHAEASLNNLALFSPFESDTLSFQYVGGIDLGSHSQREETLAALRNNSWDYVFLQDFSTRPLENPTGFQASIDFFVKEIRRRGAEPILYAPWARKLPLLTYRARQVEVSAQYMKAASRHGLAMARVGDLWLQQFDFDRALFNQLFVSDGIHATTAGQFAIAASIYKVLYQSDLIWAPAFGVPGGTADKIRTAAANLNITRAAHLNARSPMSAIPVIVDLLLE